MFRNVGSSLTNSAVDGWLKKVADLPMTQFGHLEVFTCKRCWQKGDGCDTERVAMYPMGPRFWLQKAYVTYFGG